jgi:arylsulfatase A-like enzyme
MAGLLQRVVTAMEPGQRIAVLLSFAGLLALGGSPVAAEDLLPGLGSSVTLAAETTRDILIHVPSRAPRLAIDLEGRGAEVTLVANAGQKPAPELARVRAAGRTSRQVDLTAFGGRVVQLSLRASGPGDVVIHELALSSGDRGRTPSPEPRPWNVVVYVIDTLRADHLGCYGGAADGTPRIDAFARSAVRFAHAVSQSSWTLPSIASLLTGLSPAGHGAADLAHGIRPDVATLAEVLARSSYSTAAFVTNYLGSGVYGLDRGFETFRFYPERGATRRKVYLRSDALYRRIVRWLDRRPGGPFMLWVHATDPHYPYLPPPRHTRWRMAPSTDRQEIDRIVDDLRPLHNGNEGWGSRPAAVAPDVVALLRDLYAGEVRAADRWFGGLLDELESRGLLDNTVIALTSDHGEEFLEHGGLAHGQTLYREVLDVPLLVRLPGGVAGGTSVDGLARHVDLLPTILSLVGVPAPPGLDGVALFGPDASTPETAYAALRLGRFDQDAVVTPRWKVIRNLRTSRVWLFDTVADPMERIEVGAGGDLRLQYATTRLQRLTERGAAGPPVGGDRVERLQALGYVTD